MIDRILKTSHLRTWFRWFLFVLLCVFGMTQRGDAQTMRLHNHPQKAFYTSPAEWPVVSSQCHWRPGSGMPQTFPVIPVGLSVADPQIAHTHLDCNWPIYGEITGPLPISCTIKVFHTAGVVGGIGAPFSNIRDIVYADTGTSTPPVMRGDPMGVKQWNLSFIFDPTMKAMNYFPPFNSVGPHGWTHTDVSVKTYYDNGDSVNLDQIRSLYSVMDTSVADPDINRVNGFPDSGIGVATACSPNTSSRFRFEDGTRSTYGNQMGEVFSTFQGMIPLLPIQAPWSLPGRFYAYATLEGHPGFKFPDGTFSLRRDVDIHNGIFGVDIVPPQHFQGNTQFSDTPMVLDPALIGSGTHNIVAFWQEPDGQGSDNTALTVFNVTVGPGVPQPTLCTNPAATNVGGPLPCVFPPPPVDVCPNLAGVQLTIPAGLVLINGQCVPPVVVPTWVPFVATFQRLGTEDRYRICDVALHCVELAIKP